MVPLRLWQKAAIFLALFLAIGLWIYYAGINYFPDQYPPDVALENGDVVDIHGSITNIEKLDRFMENFNANGTDQLRIVRYTIEGDAILYDLSTKEGNLTLRIDTTRDKYGKGAISDFELTEILKGTRNSTVFYSAKLRTGEDISLVEVSN